MIVLALAGAAAGFDLQTGKIPNKLIIVGYVAGIIVNINAPLHILTSLWAALWPIALWYPLFFFRVFGAGDIKLFSVISVFIPWKITLIMMFYSLIGGVVTALAGLYLNPEMIKKCGEIKTGTENITLHRIHFAPAIAAACMTVILTEVF